jgi:hypothetical protein
MMVGRPRMRLRNITVGAVLCIALFVAAAPAYAQSAAQNGYAEPAGSVQQQLDSGSNDAHKVAASEVSSNDNNGGGTLPFTGLDIALVVAAGGVLLAMGLGIRRLSRTTAA